MKIHDISLAAIDALNHLQWGYMLVGGIAAIHYGLGRTTYDVDVVVELSPFRVDELVQRLGAPFVLDPQRTFEIFTGKPMQVILVPNTPFKIDVFPLTSDPFDQVRFGRRCRVRLEDRDVCLPTAEDVVVQKLRWGRPKDTEDVRDVVAVQGDALDFVYIERWCDAHGTRALLDKLRSEIPPI